MKYSHCSDDVLLQYIAQQDLAALEALFDRYAQTVFNLISRIVRNQAVAAEILQETFWHVWQNANSFSKKGTPAAWLYRIAREKSLAQLRRQAVQLQLLASDTQNSGIDHQDASLYWADENISNLEAVKP